MARKPWEKHFAKIWGNKIENLLKQEEILFVIIISSAVSSLTSFALANPDEKSIIGVSLTIGVTIRAIVMASVALFGIIIVLILDALNSK